MADLLLETRLDHSQREYVAAARISRWYGNWFTSCVSPAMAAAP
jgi:hypothetical protein